jgi:peptidoglycan/LPS O-acetylase OafA/YrhL
MVGDAGVMQAGEVRSARIESLRALAALSVLTSHVFLFKLGSSGDLHKLAGAGRYGVWMFFALTGYLLFWPFVRGGEIDLRRYALNRVLRILPLYYVVVVVLLVLNEHGGSTAQWCRFATFTQNYFTSTVGTVDVPIWSLVVEIQFYALLLAKVHSPGVADLRWRYSLPATFFAFTPGMFVALLRAKNVRLPGSTTLILASLPLWLVAALAIRWAEPLCAVAAFLVLAAVVMPVREGPLVRALGAKPLAAVGVASYSLYLWHVPLIRALNDHAHPGTLGLLIAGAALALAVAAVSYLVVERPFLRLRRRWDSGPRSEPERVVVPVRSHGEHPGLDALEPALGE